MIDIVILVNIIYYYDQRGKISNKDGKYMIYYLILSFSFNDYKISLCCQESRSTLAKNLRYAKRKQFSLFSLVAWWDTHATDKSCSFKIPCSGKCNGTLPMESVWATRSTAKSKNWEAKLNRKSEFWKKLVFLKIMWAVLPNNK